jgi:M6 family metalloprotease-like protein
MGLDTSFLYRLTNNFQGPGQALDVKADGSGRLMMAATADYSGQYWRLVELGQGKYALRTLYLGDCFSLDVINDGTNETPWLNATGNYSGQFWSLTPWGNEGTYKLTNDFTGTEKSLNVYAESFEPFVGSGDHSGQHWVLTPLRKISPDVPVPELDPHGVVYHTEGPSNYSIYARPLGTVRAVMVFVDFPDAPGASVSPSATAAHILGNGQAQQLFYDQSYGRLTLSVDVKADLAWKRMPRRSSDYNVLDFPSHKLYVSEAATLFSPAEVNFSAYAFVFIVAAPNAGVLKSPAFNPSPSDAPPSPSGPIRLAVTFGNDSYRNRYITLVHEVGHLFDLPDVYPERKGADDSQAGCWDIMSDIFHSVSFLGWHRHKNGWLDPSRILYINQRTSAWYTTLSPLSGGCGLSIVVLPIDDATKPSKVFVIEVAQPVLGTNDQYWGEGILLYTVDAKVPSLQSPLMVLPKTDGDSADYGHLYHAPYGVGDHASVIVGGASVTLTVIQKFGSSYNIRISYKKSSSWITAVLDAIRDLLAGFDRLFRSVFRLPLPPDRWPAPRDPETERSANPTPSARPEFEEGRART